MSEEQFKGCESEALRACIALYGEASEKSEAAVREEIQTRVDERRESLTARDLDERNYTYVTVVVGNLDARHRYQEFLVASPYRERALVLAKRYVEKQGWQLEAHSRGEGDARYFSLYPRNYIRKSRALWRDGKYL